MADPAHPPTAAPIMVGTCKTPLSIIRCVDHGLCSLPEPVPGGRIVAPLVGTREAMLTWSGPPRRCLLVKKWHDADARDAAVEVGEWLREELGVEVVVYEDPEEAAAGDGGGDGLGTRFPPHMVRYEGTPRRRALGSGGSGSGGIGSSGGGGSPAAVAVARRRRGRVYRALSPAAAGRPLAV